MSPDSHHAAGRGFAVRLALFYAVSFAVFGVYLPFIPVWLAAKGFDADGIGLLLAVATVVRVLAIPSAARTADRRQALRGAIIATTSATFVGFAIIGLLDGEIAIVVVFLLLSATFAPVIPMVEAYAVRGLSERGRSYGSVRLWGSAAFIVGSLGAGLFLDLLPPKDLVWLIAAGFAVAVFFAFALEPTSAGARRQTASGAEGSLWLTPIFLLVLAAASLLQASHAVYYGFSALAWRADGYDGTTIGLLWALGIIAEIILFAFSGRFPPVITPTVLLIVGGAGGATRWAAMAFDPPFWSLPFLQGLHAFSFGATHLGAIGFVSRAAPPHLAATAQGYLAVALGLVMAGAIGLSGVLYARYGTAAYGAMALGAVCGLGFAIAAHRLASRSVSALNDV
jgi:PPP family 3-phenylpropionic acid transporter